MQTTFTQFENFGHSLRSPSYRIQPKTAEDIYEAFQLAKRTGLTVNARGAGRSYNDAALNGGGILLDMSGMNQILEWDPTSGVVRCEPGVTLEKLWTHVEPHGWWPPVVPGTMRPTLGGCLAMNIHGKNNFRTGPIGEHVLAFEALLPTGEWVKHSEQTGKFEVSPNAMHFDGERLYVGSGDRGLLVYNVRARRWTTVSAGLTSQTVTAVTSDDRRHERIYHPARGNGADVDPARARGQMSRALRPARARSWSSGDSSVHLQRFARHFAGNRPLRSSTLTGARAGADGVAPLLAERPPPANAFLITGSANMLSISCR